MDVVADNRLVGQKYGITIVNGGNAHLGNNYYIQSNDQNADDVADLKELQTTVCESLQFAELRLRFSAIDEAHQSTFEWLFQDNKAYQRWDNFTEWLKHGREIYLIEGKPGSGKSTLMRYIYYHEQCGKSLVENTSRGEPLILYHFFWLAGSPLQRSYKGMLATLAHQLIVNCSVESFATFHEKWPVALERTRSRLSDWTETELQRVVSEILNILTVSRPLLVLVDGLDEFDHQDRPSRVVSFLRGLNSWPTSRVCVSSRPLIWLEENFASAQKLRLHELTKEDIRKYAYDILQEDFSFFGSDLVEEQATILRIIESKAEGVFLWVKYALDRLRESIVGCDDAQGLKQGLEELPQGMERLFEHM